jgi:hypothetical protein
MRATLPASVVWDVLLATGRKFLITNRTAAALPIGSINFTLDLVTQIPKVSVVRSVDVVG